jgi:hypothetical protein
MSDCTPGSKTAARTEDPDPAAAQFANNNIAVSQHANTTPAQAAEIKSLDLGPTYRQCSSARSASSTMTVTEISKGNCSFTSATSPAIGSLDWPCDESVL